MIECVYLVVDRVAAETHCTTVEGNAAEALAQRAEDLDRPAPRYKGNFLCAIDGYPQAPECGDDPPNDYWSVWYYSGGKWVYSSLGVADLMVEDRDRDGHPDPLGFRLHEVDEKAPPRASPAYPKPAPTRSARPSAGPTTAGPRPTAKAGGASGSGGPGATTATPGGTGGPGGTPGSGPGSATAGPGTGAESGATGATPASTGAAGGEPGGGGRGGGGDFPVGTAAGAVLAAGLIGAAALRFRRPS